MKKKICPLMMIIGETECKGKECRYYDNCSWSEIVLKSQEKPSTEKERIEK